MLIYTDSFEVQNGSLTPTGVDSDRYVTTGSTSASASGARTGTYCVFQANLARRVRASEEHATFIMGVALLPSTSAHTGSIAAFTSDSNATFHVLIELQSDGSIKAYRGAFTTLLGQTAAGVVKFNNTWQYIELKSTLSDTVGTVVIRVDETVVLNLSGVDTKNAGTKTVFDAVQLFSPATADGVDDFYICNGSGSTNTDFLGAVHIECLLPNGNGNSSQGVGSDGNSTNNYLLVNDSSNTTYVDLAATGDKDTYAFTDSTQPTANAVYGVMAWAYAEKTDAGARSLNLVARSGTSESTQAADALVNGVFHTVGASAFETKPGGGAWTVADVNAAEFGISAA